MYSKGYQGFYRTMEYIKAPMKGIISSRILFGHLLGGGFRHSSKGSGFLLGGISDMHLRGDRTTPLLNVFERNVGHGA
jgi:hypothetical protein